MFSAISALRAHQTRMDVIGDNIANVNTVGFKSSRTTFSSVFASVLRSATAPDTNTGRGGSNPMQIGLGAGVASIDMNMTRGSLQRTDNSTDLAIEGDGFFVVGGDGNAPRYTRAGNFSLDEIGNLVTSSGLNVLGWMFDPQNNSIDTTKTPSKINILARPTIAPKATDKVVFSGNLNSSTDLETNNVTDYSVLKNVAPSKKYSTSFKVFDSQGQEHTLQLIMVKTGDNTWRWIVDGIRDTNDNYVDSKLQQNGNSFIAYGDIQFDTTGKVKSNGITIIGGNNVTASDFTIKFTNGVVDDIKFSLSQFDLSQLTQYGMDSSITVQESTGYAAGNLQGFNVDSSGKITGVYSNGLNQLIGQIAIATFANPAGLQRIGDNLFINTVNSGDAEIGVAGSGSRGTISQGTLEMSNVDLAKEFTDMIVTQRGYQANARVITSSDELLQDLVNIKR